MGQGLTRDLCLEQVLHETGHVLGLWVHHFRARTGHEENRQHPSVPLSVMNEDEEISSGYDEPDCHPHPMDILAIYASHQASVE